jgi:hypothetical protein
MGALLVLDFNVKKRKSRRSLRGGLFILVSFGTPPDRGGS